ncbi:MAG: CHAT domain-containing protein [Scytonematopsis contorta HA4267-MV1]|jgi:CHAT domain-containing protein|nr:CHAT domain-containing protein [Scytonematopsis contorta HA4267-MV1]
MNLFTKLKTLRLMGVLFLIGFTISIWLSYVPQTIGQVSKGLKATFDTDLPTVNSSIMRIKIAHKKDELSSKALTDVVFKGLRYYQAGDLPSAIATWERYLRQLGNLPNPPQEVVQVWKYLTRAYQQTGNLDLAINYLNQLIAYYRQAGNLQQVGRILTELAQIYSSLGQYNRAVTILCSQNVQDTTCTKNSAIAIAKSGKDTAGEAAALGSLGNTLQMKGDYQESLKYFDKSLKLAQQVGNKTYISSALNGLGNTYASLAKRNYNYLEFANSADDAEAVKRFTQLASESEEQAIKYFQKSLELAETEKDINSQMRSLLNLAVSQHRNSQYSTPHSPLPTPHSPLQKALTLLEQLPDSREKAFTAIRLANLLRWVEEKPTKWKKLETELTTRCTQTKERAKVLTLLEKASAIAERIQDKQAAAFAFGRLGHVYECEANYQEALNWTQKALIQSQQEQNRYLWEWQSGRIAKAQGNTQQAIISYDMAVQTLKDIRSDIAIVGRDLQLDFREAIEPIYRELALLQLQQTSLSNSQLPSLSSSSSSSPASLPGLQTIDALRVSELQNYLGSECTLEPIAKSVNLIDEETAVINSIIFEDRVAVIATLPNKEKGNRFLVNWIPYNKEKITILVNKLRRRLEKRSDLANTYIEPAKTLYDLLIKPFVLELNKTQTKTLVFVQDGILRSIPMATLYDGKKFLVEKYAIANNPSLSLVEPTRLNPNNLRVLAFGLTEPSIVQGSSSYNKFFEALSNVRLEIERILKTIPGEGLYNGQFTSKRLEQELQNNDFPIIHLATHGRFGIDARETFLVMGKGNDKRKNSKDPKTKTDKYNEKLSPDHLYQIIRSNPRGKSVELLALTACETAAGSDRDALGIAGISLQAGAKSAIASLWQVDDLATADIITKFYQNLRNGTSRAKALQQAQISWLSEHKKESNHPGYWAALILVGNWL